MAFLLAEDKALRERLMGITVYDQKSDEMETTRKVGVYFGQPDQELRAQIYPYITIDLIDINRDFEREIRGKTSASYLVPEGVSVNSETEAFETDFPIPVSLDYQITAYSRNPVHDRVLMSQLMYSKLPFRFGYIEVVENTSTVQDVTTNTITYRRLDVLDVSKRDMTESGKRLFMNAVTVRISSEIPQDTYRKITRVQEADFSVTSVSSATISVTTLPDDATSITETFTISE